MDGERIVYEKTNGQIKRYFYDESGIAGFEYSGQKYVFRKNLQGDVVGICSSSGTLIGEYVYDAWGNLLEEPESDVLLANPFRYRGYYYDSSIGLYYLNSRYYDPETGRFLNEDLVSYLEPETIGGVNLYAYCLNDPVNNIDPSGHLVISLLIALAVTGAVVGGTTAGLIASNNGAQGWELAGSILGGALLGGAIGALAGLGLPMIGGTAGGALAIAGGGTAGGSIAISAVGLSVGIFSLTLLFSRIVEGNGYRIDHHYPNDHDPIHVHISGDQGQTKVDLNGNPLPGQRPMTVGERKIFWRYIDKIKDALKRWL